MSQQVFLVAVLGVVAAARSRRVDFTRVNIHTVLSLLRETDLERDQIVGDVMRRVFGQSFLFGAVFVQSGHEIGQRARHAELALQLAAGEDQRVLVSDGHQSEESSGFHRSPFTAGAVGQRHHHRLQVGADDFELANTLELHRLARQVFSGRDGVGEDVEEESSTARGVHSESHDVADDRLFHHSIQ